MGLVVDVSIRRYRIDNGILCIFDCLQVIFRRVSYRFAYRPTSKR